MQPQKDYQIRDVGRTVVRLRSDLVFTPHFVGGKRGYVIEDPINTKFYRVGIAEYRFISLLDGTTTVADALSATAATLMDQAFTQHEAAAICKWLVDSGLAHTSESSQSGRLTVAAEKADRASILRQLNPMYIRLPIFLPQRILDYFTFCMGWLHGAFGWGMTAILGLIASCQLCVHWDRFLGTSLGIMAPQRWLWLGLAWLLLKVVHELSHAVVCRKYGGSVKEFGVIFVLFAPLAYVDVTSSWRFRSKWHRIHTAAAGMYVELLIASVAALVWCRTEPGLLNDMAFNLVVMASFTTVVFNANPLMRFDGYYILSDLLELPNLYANGQKYVHYVGYRYLLGTTRTLERWPPGKGAIIKCYGIAAFAWRVLVSVALVIAATTMFAGAGIVIAAMATALWLGPALVRFTKSLFCDSSLTTRNRLQFLTMAAAAATLIVLLFTVIPWPGLVRAPAIVEYSPLVVVRAGTAGFLTEIKVRNNQSVVQGDVLAILRNEELRVELSQLELEIDDCRLLCRTHQTNQHLAAYQAEMERREALEKRWRQKQREVDQLTVRSPANGQIIGCDADALQDTYLKQGSEICCLGNNRTKEVRISVAQDDLEKFSRQITKPVMIRLRGATRFSSPLTKVSPRASTEPPHAALCAPNGGPLAVRRQDPAANVAFKLLAPRFPGVVTLDEPSSSPLHAGQSGVVSFWDGSDTFGKHAFNAASEWMRAKFEQAKKVSATN